MMNIRKGFTLMEIIIVVAFTGALSTALAVSNRNAETSAQVRMIISRLRNARTAALLKQKDGDVKYLEGCMIVRTEEGIYAGCELSDNEHVRGKLTAKAEAIGLLGSDMKTPYSSGGEVWIQVLSAES